MADQWARGLVKRSFGGERGGPGGRGGCGSKVGDKGLHCFSTTTSTCLSTGQRSVEQGAQHDSGDLSQNERGSAGAQRASPSASQDECLSQGSHTQPGQMLFQLQ